MGYNYTLTILITGPTFTMRKYHGSVRQSLPAGESTGLLPGARGPHSGTDCAVQASYCCEQGGELTPDSSPAALSARSMCRHKSCFYLLIYFSR